MALATQASRAFICARCQIRLACAASIPCRSACSVRFPYRISNQSTRSFVTAISRLEQQRDHENGLLKSTNSDQEPAVDQDSFTGLRQDIREDDGLRGENSTSNVAQTPWYLQEQVEEEPVFNPFLERQKIPALPANPPPILKPLLQQLSIDLGLDYLALLDLRQVDPPPALGANLIMIFGSARSEKHLNVSADRLCRWLRKSYQLRPTADGLLGRNELKLKLKRKNRRAKMMSAAGATMPLDSDDGITTGWICVDLGTVEDGPKRAEETEEAVPGFIGFGGGFYGAKIVVQIMTESKRGDLDLEGLWNETLDQSSKSKGSPLARGDKIDGQHKDYSSGFREERNSTSRNGPSLRNDSSVQEGSLVTFGGAQVRSYHTSARRRAVDSGTIEGRSETSFVPTTSKGDTDLSTKPPEASAILSADIPIPIKSFQFSGALQKQLTDLKKIKQNVAVWLLGENQHDRSSTSFLKDFYQNIPVVPQPSHLFAQFELQCYAIRIGHPGYTREYLLRLLRHMQSAAILIPEETFIVAFETVLMAHNLIKQKQVVTQIAEPSENVNAANGTGRVIRRILRLSFEVLERMESYGHDARSAKIFGILHNAIAKPVFHLGIANADDSSKERTALKLSPFDQSNLRHQFRRALDSLYLPEPGDNKLYTYLLRSYITESPPDWDSFWTLWRQISRQMRPRTPEMYALMFGGVAHAEHASKCQEVLMWQFPEMSRETPVVECKGVVASSVIECLIRARVPRNQEPWIEMWNSAERGVYKDQSES